MPRGQSCWRLGLYPRGQSCWRLGPCHRVLATASYIKRVARNHGTHLFALTPCYYSTGPEGPHQNHASPEPRKARRLASTHARGLDEISACDGMGASKPPKSHHKMWTRDRMAHFVAFTLAQWSVLLEAGTFAQRPSAGTFAHGQSCWRLGP